MLRPAPRLGAGGKLRVGPAQEALEHADPGAPARAVERRRLVARLQEALDDRRRAAAERLDGLGERASDPQSAQIAVDQTIADGVGEPFARADVDERERIGLRAQFRQVAGAYPAAKRPVEQEPGEKLVIAVQPIHWLTRRRRRSTFGLAAAGR